jgi:hypothetical protein
MSDSTIEERFTARYRPAIESFVNDIEGLDASGIPEPHLPFWGSLYEAAPLRVGVIGRDTRGWGDMTEFIECVRADSQAALARHREELDGLAFTGWTNNFGKTFWDTTMKILAAMHDVNDWKLLKKRQDTTPLRSFFWANVNTIERFEVCPRDNGVPWETWRKVKDSSEKHLDSFKGILDVFRPHMVFLMNWDPGDHFLDFDIEWKNFGDHQASAFYEPAQTHIFATAHPTWLNQNSIYDEAITGIIEEANKTRHSNPYQPPCFHALP